VCLLLARKGAHVMVADVDARGAEAAAAEASAGAGADFVADTTVDLGLAESIAQAIRDTILRFGGIDLIVNTAGIYPVSTEGAELSEQQWAQTFRLNVTGNYLLCHAAECVFKEQGLRAAVVLTSSANAAVPKSGSEAYDASKAALSHLVRELAVALAPRVRVNAIAPATVVAGSAMFSRERVVQSLEKYKIEFSASEATEALRAKLAEFYAQRTLTESAILPQDCANAILWLLSDESAKTTGHVIPVDGGLPEAFLR
jgi:NAD(P)-dependent dehydrogenase (short-subunit alcohol dehydrogenase family)